MNRYAADDILTTYYRALECALTPDAIADAAADARREVRGLGLDAATVRELEREITAAVWESDPMH